jgi:L-2,4-diaminobutyrate transaminase
MTHWHNGIGFFPPSRITTYARGETQTRVIKTASGVYIEDRDGTKMLGVRRSLCVNVGYGRQEIAEAVQSGASWRTITPRRAWHRGVDHAVKMILDRAPANMSKVYFGQSGSDANETNIKLIWYNNMPGRLKEKIISRWRSYHRSGPYDGVTDRIGVVPQ